MTIDDFASQRLLSPQLQLLSNDLLKWFDSFRHHSGITTFVGLQAALRLLVVRRWSLLTDSEPGAQFTTEVLQSFQGIWTEIEGTGVGMTAVVEAQMLFLESLCPDYQGLFSSSPISFHWQSVPESLLRSLVDCLSRVDNISAFSPVDLYSALLLSLLPKWYEREVVVFRLLFLSDTLERLMLRLLALEPGLTIYDPFATLGQFFSRLLVDPLFALSDSSQPLSVYGQLPVSELAAVTRLIFLLLGKHFVVWQDGDAYDAPFLATDGRLQQFDRVISALPFFPHPAQDHDFYQRFPFGIPSTMESDGLYIQQAFSSLREHGRAVLLISASFLFRQSARLVRRGLVDADLLRAIIVLPPLCLPTHNRINMPTAILVLERDKSTALQDHFLLVDYVNIQVNADRSFDVEPIVAAMALKPDDPDSMSFTATDTNSGDEYLVRWISRSQCVDELYNLNPSLYWPRRWQQLNTTLTLQMLVDAESEHLEARNSLDCSLRALGWDIPDHFPSLP